MEEILKSIPRAHKVHVEEIEDISERAIDCFSIFEKERRPFILESSLYNRRFGRFTFFGANPFLVIQAFGDTIEVSFEEKRFTLKGNPFSVLDAFIKRTGVASGQTPVPFAGGAVGYFGYELGHFIEKLPPSAPADLPLPDMYFAFYDRVVAVDLKLRKSYCSALVFKRDSETAEEKIAGLKKRLSGSSAGEMPEHDMAAENLTSNFTKARYMDAVRKTIDYIAAGDIFQANISQRFKARLAISDFELFRRLRRVNPAPFSAYLRTDKWAVISSSPERFLKVTDGIVETRPIKGTRGRGRTHEEDERLRNELLSSVKDGAELAMIVDLERNDLGRVCSYASVHVAEKKVLEEYASVFHLVATVTGRLHEGENLIDLLRATFPGGSITGAPKIRAMEIINEIEPTRRSVYTGAIGYIGCDGNMDLNIAIRTILKTGDVVTFQVGGGIVADSQPEAEYQETLDKAKGLLESLKAAKAREKLQCMSHTTGI